MHVNLPIPNALLPNTLTKLFHPMSRTRRTAFRVATPCYFLQWLGISQQQLSVACAEQVVQANSYIDAACSSGDDEHGPTPRCPEALDETVTYATCVATDSLPSELGAAHQAIRHAWRARVTASYGRVLARFKQQRPAAVVVVQGFEPHNAVARCAALHLDITVIAVENTAIADRMVWDNVAGITTNRNVAKSYFWRFQNRIDLRTSEKYCQRLIERTKQLKSAEHRSPATRQQHSSDRPTVLFLGQVYTDSSQVFGLRRWASPLAILQQCVRWCRQHDHDLVVKLHPKENAGNNTIDDRPYDRLTYRKITSDQPLARALREMGTIIDEDNSYDTYELINNCALAVTVNSQAGLEASIRGKGIVVCGDAFYSGLDFTCDAPDPLYFDSAMQAARHNASETTARARQFAYIFFEKYCRKKNADELLRLVKENT